MKKHVTRSVAFVVSAFAATTFAQVRIGVTVSATGPAASLGIPERNTVVDVPEGSCRQDGRIHRARRRLRHDDRRAEHAQADRRIESRRDHRLDDDPELTRDARRIRRRADAGDLARVVGADHRAGRCEARMVVQDAADRRDDGRRDPRARRRRGREDAGLRRFLRRARRGVLRRDREGGGRARHSARRQRTLRAEGHERRRTGAEADRREARCRGHRRIGYARRAAGDAR